MSAVRLEIDDANLESVMPIGIASTVPMGSRRREYLWASVALASLLGVGGLATRAWLTPAPDISTVRFEVWPPEGTSFAAGANGSPQLSPDGRTLGFVAVSQFRADGKPSDH